MNEKEFYVYIMTNKNNTVLYTGVTNDLLRRVQEHKSKRANSFTARYNIDKLVYFEAADSIIAAIEYEKRIKGWLREKKMALIKAMNPEFKDLSEGWF